MIIKRHIAINTILRPKTVIKDVSVNKEHAVSTFYDWAYDTIRRYDLHNVGLKGDMPNFFSYKFHKTQLISATVLMSNHAMSRFMILSKVKYFH